MARDVLPGLRVLSGLAKTEITLTESMAMLPTAAVSGMYFLPPEAKYFAVGPIGDDQMAEYKALGGKAVGLGMI